MPSIRVAVATHATPRTGSPSFLIEYLRAQVGELFLIIHPLYKNEGLPRCQKHYINGALVWTKKSKISVIPELISYAVDFLSTIFFILRQKRKVDIFIGADPLNAFAGILLQKLRFACRSVYYVIDYTPYRFKSFFPNILYQTLCIFCAKWCNFNFNLSTRMVALWKRFKIDCERNLLVPRGAYFGSTHHLHASPVNRRALVFMGHLTDRSGIQLCIEALVAVVNKVNDVKLFVIGSGPAEDSCKKLVERLGLSKHVHFLGYIKDYGEILRFSSRCAVGLAPYQTNPKSFTYYADPGKVKAYLSSGLPVVVTRVPAIALDIENAGACLVITYDKDALSQAILRLLTDNDFFANCRESAMKLSVDYDWERIFERAFKPILATLHEDVD